MKYRNYLLISGVFIFLIIISLALYLKIFQTKPKNNPDLTCYHCNILLLDIDTLRADALPCYGYRRNTAPNICSFAEKSVIFTDNYSSAGWTLPSIFSTITSLYPTFHKVRTEYKDRLSPYIPTLAEAFRREGYTTILAGGLNDTAVPSRLNGGLRGYDQVVMDKTLEQLISELSNKNRPWFIHFYRSDLHMPYLLPDDREPMENLQPPKNLPIIRADFNRLLNIYIKYHYAEIFNQKGLTKYKSILETPTSPDDIRLVELFNQLSNKNEYEYLKNSWSAVYNTYMESFDMNNKIDVAYVRMLYDTKISVLDEELKPLFRILDSKLYSQNTISIIMSDHGEAFGEHGVFSHDDTHHSELFYVPLILRVPDLKNRRVSQASGNIDIFPTLLELTGSNRVGGLQGRSLISRMDIRNSGIDSFIESETFSDGIIFQNRNWLYFLQSNDENIGQSILYDKIQDPAESENIAPVYLGRVRALYDKASLIRSYQKTGSSLFDNQDGQIKLDPEKLKRLQNEGYF